jgi:alanine-glyoxylate transaminase/serine-glyoxylate transaminase/serine-pyruvate transaminase
VWLPPGVDDVSARRTLLDHYGIEVVGGVGEFAGRTWRIGCMGHTARPRNVTLLLGALEELLAP